MKPVRYENLDLLRLWATLSIVLFHVMPVDHPFHPYLYQGVMIFLLTSGFLLGLGKFSTSFQPYATQKAERLLWPWLVWGLFYGVLQALLTGWPSQEDWNIPAAIAVVYGGGYVHLWYLSFLYIFSLATWLLFQPIMTLEPKQTVTILASLGVLCLGLEVWVLQRSTIPWPWIQTLSSAPVFCWGLSLGQTTRLPPALGQRCRLWIFPWLVIGLCLPLALTSPTATAFMYFISMIIGIVCFCGSFQFQSGIHPYLKQVSDLTLGIYLIHPFWILVVYKVATQLGTIPLLGQFLIVLLLSGLSTVILKQIPYGKTVV